MLIIRLYTGPIFVGNDDEEQDNDTTTTDVEDAAATGSFAA